MSAPKKIGIVFLILMLIAFVANRMKNQVLDELMNEDD